MSSKNLKNVESKDSNSVDKNWGNPIEFLMTCIGNLKLKFISKLLKYF